MASDFRMQIVNFKTGKMVSWLPGSPIEVDIVDELCKRIATRGVGLFRSEKKVLTAIKEEFAGVIWDLKSRV